MPKLTIERNLTRLMAKTRRKSKRSHQAETIDPVLEFEHSRSAYFDFALALAQRQEGYTMLLDENRRIIYRVVFRKNKLSSFWRL